MSEAALEEKFRLSCMLEGGNTLVVPELEGMANNPHVPHNPTLRLSAIGIVRKSFYAIFSHVFVSFVST
jgi:hypothetical protein